MKLLSDWPPFLERIWFWCIENFSLRKITFRTFLLVIICSLSYQIGVVLPTISEQHPYSDALIYQDLSSGSIDFFGSTHITHRVLAPSIIQGIQSFIPVDSAYLFAIIQFGLLLIVLHRVYNQTDGIAFSFFFFLLIGFTSFWRGFFLPMTDTFLWAFLTLFWLEARNKDAKLLTLLAYSLLAFFSKEMAGLALILLLLSVIPSKKKAIVAFISSGLLWFIADYLMSTTISNNYIYQSDVWMFDWLSNLYNQWIYIPKYLLSGFGLVWIAWIFRVGMGGKVEFKHLVPELLLFGVIFLFAATNSPRLFFPFSGIIILRLFQK